MKNKIIEIINRTIPSESKKGEVKNHSYGSKNQRERLKNICELSLQNTDGDILEIGAHVGLTTQIFCELAKKYNRKVIVVDPWNGQQEGNQMVYEQFKKNTENYDDVLSVYRQSSLTNESRELIQSKTLSFCFVDGLHTVEACGYDIQSCISQKGIIAVDDLTWVGGLKELVENNATSNQREFVIDENIREGYII